MPPDAKNQGADRKIGSQAGGKRCRRRVHFNPTRFNRSFHCFFKN